MLTSEVTERLREAAEAADVDVSIQPQEDWIGGVHVTVRRAGRLVYDAHGRDADGLDAEAEFLRTLIEGGLL